MSQDLPVADAWYERSDLGGGLTLITEPHVDVLCRSNIWHLSGRDRDLLVDGGMGIVPLRPAFPDLFEGRETLALATHTHVDHIGAIHEFDHRLVHPIEAARLEAPKGSLVSADMDAGLRALFVEAGYPPLGRYLVDALPHAGFDPAAFRQTGAAPTRLVAEGETIDLGDRRFRVLLVPGHSPGSVALFEDATGTLFSGDILYDGPLLYRGPGMNVEAYRRSLDQLSALPVTIVHAGHDPSFGKARLDAIVAAILARWRSEALIDG